MILRYWKCIELGNLDNTNCSHAAFLEHSFLVRYDKC
jgi:hypothetical protein